MDVRKRIGHNLRRLRNPSVLVLQRIAVALEVDIAELFGAEISMDTTVGTD
jgi:hypothetical protein